MLQYDSNLIIETLEKVKIHRPHILEIFGSPSNFMTHDLLTCIEAKSFNLLHAEEISDLLKTCHMGLIDMDYIRGNELEIIKDNIEIFRNTNFVLDPSKANLSEFRRNEALYLIENLKVRVLRGNQEEILALDNFGLKAVNMNSEQVQEMAINAAKNLSSKYNIITVLSGMVDYITDGENFIAIKNGHPILGKISGTGNALSSLIAAFLSVMHEKELLAVTSAVSLFSIAGQIAGNKIDQPGKFRGELIDIFNSLNVTQIQKNLTFADFSYKK